MREEIETLVFLGRAGDCYRAGRTLRAVTPHSGLPPTLLNFAAAQSAKRSDTPIWLVRAGAWPVEKSLFKFPAASKTQQPLCALGTLRANSGHCAVLRNEANKWAALKTATGGDFAAAANLAARLPPLASVYLDRTLAARFRELLSQGIEIAAAIRSVVCLADNRVVHYPHLDVHDDLSLRVAQVITSLQLGGAERVAIDLATELPGCGIRPLLIAIGAPSRSAFPAPKGTLDLSTSGSRTARIAAAADAALAFAADLVHGHLLRGEDLDAFAALKLPIMQTVHNAKPGWPEGMTSISPSHCVLLAACSCAVEADIRAAGLNIPVRTAWNGINFEAYQRTPTLEAAAREFRAQHGIKPDDFLLATLANPRPQKRLELLPAVLLATREVFAHRGIRRDVHLFIAGEPSRGNDVALQSEAALRGEIARLGLADHFHLIGPVQDVAPVLAAADALVSTSAYEGLSLTHLEALAAGIPVVATVAGGTAEIAKKNPTVFLLPLDASPESFAEILGNIARQAPTQGSSASAINFTRTRMAQRYAWLYPRAVHAATPRKPGEGLLLIANNFSTGGAQSSARRLLLGLHARNIRVRAAVLQEQKDFPTPGRRTLEAAGVPVQVLPPAGSIDPAEAVATLLESIDSDPPQAVIFWNAITEYKVLLADALWNIPVFDVSPGEMYFESMERYFNRPRPGLPYRTPADYGARLAGVIVKYEDEAARARQVLRTRVHIVPNGVPLETAAAAARSGSAKLIIGTVARISPQKKLEELLAALKVAHERMPPYLLRIAGRPERDGNEYAQKLKSVANGLPVEWNGDVDESVPFLRELDLFAMISEPAGCPNASLEAMAAGLAVIATDVGGAREQVEDGVTGRLVPRGDVRALAEALLETAHSPELRARYGAAGRDRAERLFDAKRMVSDYQRICLA